MNNKVIAKSTKFFRVNFNKSTEPWLKTQSAQFFMLPCLDSSWCLRNCVHIHSFVSRCINTHGADESILVTSFGEVKGADNSTAYWHQPRTRPLLTLKQQAESPSNRSWQLLKKVSDPVSFWCGRFIIQSQDNAQIFIFYISTSSFTNLSELRISDELNV